MYNLMNNRPDIKLAGPARHDILARKLYNYKGVQMVDLMHASRGCKFNCYPCAVAYLGGRSFRPRPVETAVAEMKKKTQTVRRPVRSHKAIMLNGFFVLRA